MNLLESTLRFQTADESFEAYPFDVIVPNGSISADGAVVTLDYGAGITWGDGLSYSSPTASVDYNTTNLQITSNQINTIQDIDTAADVNFNSLTLESDVVIDSDSGQLKLGEDQDANIYHDGSDLYIDNNTGNMQVEGSDFRFSDSGTNNFSIGLLSTSGNNPFFYLGGYLTSYTAEKWIRQSVDDSTEYYLIEREGTSVKGCQYNMPVYIYDTDTDATHNAFQIDADGLAPMQVQFTSYKDASAGQGVGFTLRYAEGTLASPSIITLDDRLGFFVWAGYDGVQFRNSAAIEARTTASGTISTSSMPTMLSFETTKNGAVDRIPRLEIDTSFKFTLEQTTDVIRLWNKNGNANDENLIIWKTSSDTSDNYYKAGIGAVDSGLSSARCNLYLGIEPNADTSNFTYTDAQIAIKVATSQQQVIINPNVNDVDFIVKKNTTGTAIKYVAGTDETYIGDGGTTNYLEIEGTGNLKFNGSAEFHPPRVAQSAIPTPSVGELQVWRDTDDGKVYVVYNDTDSGVKSVELT